MYLVLSFLITHRKTQDTELNSGKHSRKVICPQFHCECNFDFLLSFSVDFSLVTFSNNLLSLNHHALRCGEDQPETPTQPPTLWA